MERVVRNWLTVGLTALFVFLAASSLAIPAVSADQASLPPCHQSAPVPNSPDSHNSDHACCAVGHNQALLTNVVVVPFLQLGNTVKEAAVAQVSTATKLTFFTVTDSGPPVRNSSPIRI